MATNTHNNPSPEWLTPAEAAPIARCDRNFIYEALQSGELKGFQRNKPKGRWLIDPDDLQRWIRGE
ncbi:helix-turn-helix domain-containing protein [Rhodococcus erythropolis]|uniref:helix-turn-helix domain-containing protein n=1 Tax=Rhodococcus erythropolis TaxID=1833 RepID=UPI003830AF9B